MTTRKSDARDDIAAILKLEEFLRKLSKMEDFFNIFEHTNAYQYMIHQDILGGWRVGLTNSSPVLNFEEERGRAPD